MAVVIETTLGDITVDLYLDQRPVTCLNFLKLCKMKYYNYNLFHSIRSGFIAQTGDPTGEGSGGQSIFGVLEGPSKRFFSGEKMPKIRHTNAGLLSMVCTGDMMVGSQFFFTLAPDLDSLDGVHCVIGEVTEGHDILRKLNEVICDDTHRPYQDVRITHTVILEDPFNDPTGFRAPSRSPSPSAERLKGGRIAPDEDIDETQGKTAEEVQEMIEEKEAKARATILEIVGDLPDADIAPPENVLFVCKLNPVTSDEDLEIIFSRFGKIVSCEVIRDKKTGDSLQYAFIEFSDKKSCEDAYFKMDNVLIDDRRIHVDFSQSVSKMRYLGKGRGVKYLDENDTDYNHVNNKSGSSKNKDKTNNRHHDKERNHVNKRNEYDDNINNKEKQHKSIRDSNNHRDRSRSRSPTRSNRSKDVKRRNTKLQHNSKRSEQNTNHEHNHKHEERNSNSRHLKTRYSPDRQKSYSSEKRHKDNSKSHKEDKSVSEKHSKKDKTGNSSEVSRENRDMQNKESRKSTPKRKREDSESPRDNKKIKKHDHREKERKVMSRTPTPVEKKPSVKREKAKSKQRKEEKVTKKRRKYSTSSSDSDSSDSSSTSETSTSSEDRRKKRTRKRRRRCSSSSSSSDSSESSTSSSSSSESSSTSSSSDSEPRRKKRSRKVSHRKSKRK